MREIQITTDAETAEFVCFVLQGCSEAMRQMFNRAMPNLTPKQRQLAAEEQEAVEHVLLAFEQADIVAGDGE